MLLESGKPVTMSELQIGDKVQTGINIGKQNSEFLFTKILSDYN